MIQAIIPIICLLLPVALTALAALAAWRELRQ